MIYKILEDRRILVYLALPDLSPKTMSEYESILSKHGTVKVRDDNLMELSSYKIFPAEGNQAPIDAGNYVRKILVELGNSEYL
ncbi:MAG: hypothetical protein NE328_09910 [Lentisphaeraceae bacterium]|nr:hypothetical protein [Lentisphaeraceae bacterium]